MENEKQSVLNKQFDDVSYQSIYDDKSQSTGLQGAERRNTRKVYNSFTTMVILLVVIVLGPLNFVLYKVMYSAYSDEQAFFVAQAVNFHYVIIGGAALTYVTVQDLISPLTYAVPHSKFMVMGCLDSFAGIVAGLAAKRTSGSAQQLLNQSLIPFTMVSSHVFLGTRASKNEICGAFVILLGAVVVLLPSLLGDSQSLTSHTCAQLLYLSSNVPYSMSYVYKEHGFKNLAIHVVFLTQWVSIYQLLLGFLFAPLQLIPGFIGSEPATLAGIISGFCSGFRCYTQQDESCRRDNVFLLSLGYCLVNFAFNTGGLYLVKRSSATLNAVSYAVILPLTTLAFTNPLLGRFQEPFRLSTIVGLAVTLIGFGLYRSEAIAAGQIIIDTAPRTEGFQERAIVPLLVRISSGYGLARDVVLGRVGGRV